jgi:hypothetical protein
MMLIKSIHDTFRFRHKHGLRLLSLILVLLFVITPVSGCGDFFAPVDKAVIDGVYGQFFPGRAIEITGVHLGQFVTERSRVKIDDRQAAVVSWSEQSITVIVPVVVREGARKIVVDNPPAYNNLSTEAYFYHYRTSEIASAEIRSDEDTIIETDELSIIIPAGSLKQDEKIVVRKLSRPTGGSTVGSASGGAADSDRFRETLGEYEIVNANGGHVLFDADILFGIAIDLQSDDELALHGLQYFNDVLGIWARAETIYDPNDGKLYAITSHFSYWQHFKDHMKKQIVKAADQAYDKISRTVSYPFKIRKKATDFVVDKLVELDIGTYINDKLRETFIGVSAGDVVIVYYRESDAKKDANIPDLAQQAAAAFYHAYYEYAKAMGDDNVPSVYTYKKKGFSLKDYWLGGIKSPAPYSDASAYDRVANPIKVYIDPRYNLKGANYSIVSGNTSIPSVYPDNDLETTCAHELFHVIQHHQLGKKMLYMANGLKDAAGSFSADSEVFSYLANNKWFFEATAEYASLFIGTGVGLELLHSGIEATQTYCAFTGTNNGQEYAMAAFIDYIVTDRMLQTGSRPQAFRLMWDEVLAHYSMLDSINTSLSRYTQSYLGVGATELYGEFWQDVLLSSSMPMIPVAANLAKTSAVNGITDFTSLQKAQFLTIKPEGCGIYRASVNDMTMKDIMDETTLRCSIWFQPGSKELEGLAYRLNGLAAVDRYSEPAEPVGAVNSGLSRLPEAFFTFKPGDSFAIAAFYQSYQSNPVINKMAIQSSAVSWENKTAIEKKLKNTTLSFADKLEFKAVLPPLAGGKGQYTATVTINGNEDFTYKGIKIESGKVFSVDPPLFEDSKVPPAKADVDMVIDLDGVTVHHYQSAPAKDDELVIDIAVADGKLEVGRSATFTVSGIPGNVSVSEYVWKAETNPKNLFKASQSTSSNELKLDFAKEAKLNLVVYIYGEKDGQETLLASASRQFAIEKPKETDPSKPVLTSIEGKWTAYAMYFAYGSNDLLGPKTNNFTLSIGGGSFTLTLTAPSGDTWVYVGYVSHYVNSFGDQVYELKIDSGNPNLDYQQRNDLKGQNLEALFVKLWDDGYKMRLGVGDGLLFTRDE